MRTTPLGRRVAAAAAGLALVAIAGCSTNSDAAERVAEATTVGVPTTTADAPDAAGNPEAGQPESDEQAATVAERYVRQRTSLAMVSPVEATDAEVGCVVDDLLTGGFGHELSSLDAARASMAEATPELRSGLLNALSDCLDGDRMGEAIGFDAACVSEHVEDADEAAQLITAAAVPAGASPEELGVDPETWFEVSKDCRDRSSSYQALTKLGFTTDEARCTADAALDATTFADTQRSGNDAAAASAARTDAAYGECLTAERRAELDV